jgi:RND family efflux transporter MFP subunit
MYKKIIGCILSGVLLFACKQATRETVASPATSPDSVKVFVLKKEDVKKQLVFPSELIPFEKAELFAKANGYIKTIKADIGDRVQKGQILATIDAPELEFNSQAANEEKKAAVARYAASADAFHRLETAAKVSGTIAAGELEKSRNQWKADEASMAAAVSKWGTYEQMTIYLTIRAPFSGIITQRNADAGALVGSGNAKPILVIENTETLRLRVPIQEAYTGAQPDSSSIAFTVDAQPDKKYFAKLTRKSGTISKENRTETWEFIINNPKQELKSGMYANAVIRLNRPTASFAVVPSAIATTLEKRFSIRLKDGKAEWVDVRNGMNTGDKIEIFGNLSEGDTLLVKATDEIKPGTKLIPKK